MARERHKMEEEEDIVNMLAEMKVEGYRVKVVKGHTAASKHLAELKAKEEEEEEQKQKNRDRTMTSERAFILKLLIPNHHDDALSLLLERSIGRVMAEVTWIYQVKTDHVFEIIADGAGDVCTGICGDPDRRRSPGVKKYGISVFFLSAATIETIRMKIEWNQDEYDEVEAFRRYLHVGFVTFSRKFRPMLMTINDIDCPTLKQQVCTMLVTDAKRTEEEMLKERPPHSTERRMLTGFYPNRKR